MTTIACSLLTKTMAADSQCIQGDTIYRVRKIINLGSDGLLATAGGRYLTGFFEAAFRAGVREVDRPESDESEFEALWMRHDSIWLYDCSFYHEEVGKFAAVGSGGKVALNYLLDGLTPEESVFRACRLDPYSSGPVNVEKLGV